MASTKVEIRDNRELRRVEALDDEGQVAGFADYQISVDGDTFDFHHTEVDERFEGEGIGTRIAAGVMDFLREEGLRIVPSCSFIRHYMEKNEDTHDLLADDASLDTDDGRKAEDEDGDQSDDATGDQADGQANDETVDQPRGEQDTTEEADDVDDSDEGDDDDSDDADVDSPDAGPADAKAAGSGGATDEEASRS